jgi:thiamine biosynthesis protein ThiI
MKPLRLEDWCESLKESADKIKNSQGVVVCLVSGGIDSPVATWLMIRNGLMPICVYFDNAPYTDETTKQRALSAVKKLRQYVSGSIKLYIVPHGSNLTKILERCPRNLTCVLCKRTMYRISEKIALKEGAETIVSGEIIGEHASQTLRNLNVETEALSNVTILRPLAGMNKTEVESLARKIGTFDISARPASCCTCPPKQPRTRATFTEVAAAEKKLDIETLVNQSYKNAGSLSVNA